MPKTITRPTITTTGTQTKRTTRSTPYTIEKGRAHPLGATVTNEGVNFSLFSEHTTWVQLLIFDAHDDPEPVQVITFDPLVNKTFHFWHIFVRGLKPGMHYAYRVDGPRDMQDGHRFNPNKVILDPYGFGITNNLWVRSDACTPDDNVATSLRNVIIDLRDYNWEGDKPLNRLLNETVIYEMHVGGFTRSKTAKVRNPGTFKGIIEKIPYLKSLGVTAVELLPVCQFDLQEGERRLPDGQKLTNYWGYSTVGFFAPHSEYCASPEEGQHIREFRDMVKALHKAGIEVILDVVFNHTSEGNHEGPTINFKALDNQNYYHLVPDNKQYYMDYSGCGNTFNCNHPIPEKLIIECLEFWVREMHVDGFRFDEGSILSRGTNGEPLEDAPVLWNIDLSETLADTKIIAEAWDAAGLYQVANFPGYRWSVWNGKYRDAIRRFVKGDPGIIGEVAARIAGSADLLQWSGHQPVNSINFITCHDGFTLNDLVSYNSKHNWANGEENRDGIDDNMSWNCGAEGTTDHLEVEALREQQIKNFITILMCSQGVPMFLMGDEVRRTQDGNNNTYCQDNELNWFNWNQTLKNGGLLRFFQRMVAFRRQHPILQRPDFFKGDVNVRGLADIAWHGCELNSPGWSDPDTRVLAFTLGGQIERGCDIDLHVMMNMHWEALTFELPKAKGRKWKRFVDTSLPSPNDACEPGKEVSITGNTYIVNPRSVVVLVSGK
jgi:isoamylase